MTASIREPDFDCQAFPNHDGAITSSRANLSLIVLFSLLVCSPTRLEAAFGDLRRGEVIEIAGAAFPNLHGTSLVDLSAWACGRDERPCQRIPLQIDQRDAGYRWILDEGTPTPTDDSDGRLDANDILLLRAADVGEIASADRLPPHHKRHRLTIDDPLDGQVRFAYIVAGAPPPEHHGPTDVDYDATTETFSGRRIRLGFDAGIPQSLLLITTPEAPTPLLDRFKIRARASLLWGLLRFSRDEGDLTTEVVGWKRGPVRVIRNQEQRVRLGWGIRSPRFSSYAFFYADFAELPVSLRLNHPPAALFSDVRIDVLLDFLDLSGWELLMPGRKPKPVGHGADDSPTGTATDWFALRGPTVTLLLILDVAASLETTRRTMLYRETATPQPPENQPGEWPGIGFRIDRWDDVGAGTHHLRARCFALAADVDPAAFVRAQRHPLVVIATDESDLSSR